jgi:hypothetical protein
MYDLDPFERELALFANRVDIIVGLQMGKKLSAEDAYKEIKYRFKTLKQSRKTLKGEKNKNEQC